MAAQKVCGRLWLGRNRMTDVQHRVSRRGCSMRNCVGSASKQSTFGGGTRPCNELRHPLRRRGLKDSGVLPTMSVLFVNRVTVLLALFTQPQTDAHRTELLAEIKVGVHYLGQ